MMIFLKSDPPVDQNQNEVAADLESSCQEFKDC